MSLVAHGGKRKRIVLVAEHLEDRTLPAGNVTAFVSAGILNVFGDAAANRVLVAAAGEHSFVISPVDGTTTVNGGTAPVRVGGVNAVNAQMFGGADFLHVTGTGGGLVLFVDMGAGDDGLALTFARHTGLTSISTGSGDDVVSVGASEFESLVLVNVGGGDNQVYLAGCEFDDAAIGGTGGANQLSLIDADFDRTPFVFGFQAATGLLMPRASDDAAAVRRGGSVTIDVAANDSAVSGTLNRASVQITRPPSAGTARVNPDGTITYTAPENGTATSVSFGYTIRNSAGGVSNEATVTVSLTGDPDTTAPVPTITTTAADPTGLASVPFRVTFDEAVTGFTASDITVTNGTRSGLVRINARTYTFNVTPSADGQVTVAINAGVVTDLAGNGNTAATPVVFVSDRTPPAAATLVLDPASDTGTQGDFRTVAAAGDLTGTAEAGATVELSRVAVPGTPGTLLQTATADANGAFRFEDVAFDAGGNAFGVVVVDRAGNRSTATRRTVVRALAPTVTAGDIADQTIADGQTRSFNLLDVFDTLARFETSEGDIDVELFESRAATVANFLSYVNNADFARNYDDSVFHRLDKDFVLQGGGFKFDDAGTTTATTFPPITDSAPVVNEPGISNTRGTIAMAKLGGDPDSATNEFFFNLEDNGGVPPNGLDFQNGGFTVFGEVTAAGQQVIDQIEADFQEFGGPGLPGAAPFPVRPGADTAGFPANIDAADLARIYRAVTLTDARSLTFSAPASTTPGVATAAIVDNTLTVTPGAAGTTTVSFTATSSDGLSTTVTFDVTVS